MSGVLSTQELADIKAALLLTMQTFAVKPVVIRKRKVSNVTSFGEDHDISSPQDYNLNCFLKTSVASGGRYHNVENTDRGQELHDQWTVFFWADDLAAQTLVVDPEVDVLIMDNREFELKLWVPTAYFSDLGFLLYKCDIYFKNRP